MTLLLYYYIVKGFIMEALAPPTAIQCQAQGVTFLPIVAEPSGGLGLFGMGVFSSIAKAGAAHPPRQRTL